MRGVSRSPAERARLVAEYRTSGLSAALFAAREGIAISTFYQWLRGQVPQAPVVRLARVVYSTAQGSGACRPGRQAGDSGVAIEVAGVRIQLGGDFDKGTLTAVLDVLETRRTVAA